MHAGPDSDTRSEECCPRVLVLDPDPRIAEALTLALRQEAQVEWVTSGMAGLLLAAERKVDLVIAHANLPDIASEDFLRLLHLVRPGIPIGLLGTDRPPKGSLSPQPDIYFPEPIQLRCLLRWIADCLDQPADFWPGVMSPPLRYEIPIPHLEIVRSALEIIDRSCRDGAPLSRIAQAAGVSRSHLCRVFKGVTGLSLKRFLTRRRLQAAKHLLQEPGATIDQVARRVGYRDASHFDRVFRRWEGRTPSGYRRQAILRAFRNHVSPVGNNRLAPGSPAPP